MKKKSSSKGKAASDFISFIHEWGHPEWIVLAVEASVEETSALYASAHSAKRRLPQVAIRAATPHDDEIAHLVPVVKPIGCSWSVILRSLCLPIGTAELTAAQKDAQMLSAKLKARALTFFGEDTSMAMDYLLYQDGKEAGSKEWESQNDNADPAFVQLGLRLPVCYPRRERRNTWLAAKEPWVESIQRADIIDLGEE